MREENRDAKRRPAIHETGESDATLVPTDGSKMLHTEGEAGRILGIKPRLLRDIRRRKEIGFVRVGRLVRYRQSDLEKFVENHAVKARR